QEPGESLEAGEQGGRDHDGRHRCEHHASTPDPPGERGHREQRGDRPAGEDRVDDGDREGRKAVAFAVEAVERARQRGERHHDEEGKGDGPGTCAGPGHQTLIPPSKTTSMPVMYDLSPDPTNNPRCTTSSASPS